MEEAPPWKVAAMAIPELPMTRWAAAAAAVVREAAVVGALELPRRYTLPAGSRTCSGRRLFNCLQIEF